MGTTLQFDLAHRRIQEAGIIVRTAEKILIQVAASQDNIFRSPISSAINESWPEGYQ